MLDSLRSYFWYLFVRSTGETCHVLLDSSGFLFSLTNAFILYYKYLSTMHIAFHFTFYVNLLFRCSIRHINMWSIFFTKLEIPHIFNETKKNNRMFNFQSNIRVSSRPINVIRQFCAFWNYFVYYVLNVIGSLLNSYIAIRYFNTLQKLLSSHFY